MANLTLFGGGELFDLRIGLEVMRGIVRFLTGRLELRETRVKEREQKAFMAGFWWGAGITAAIFILLLFASASRPLNAA